MANKVFFFLPLIIIASIFLIPNASATNQVIHNFTNTTTSGWNGKIILQEFPGLTPGQITKFSIKVSSTGAGHPAGIAKIYTADKDLIIQQKHNYNTANQNFGANLVFVEKFTGLPAGKTIHGLQLSSSIGSVNVRAKVFTNNATNFPGTLLGESGSTAFVNSGFLNVPLTVTIPSSGIVWAGFETINATNQIAYKTLGAGNTYYTPHTYGAGPATFSPVNNVFDSPYMNLYYGNSTGGPGALIGNSSSTLISSTGVFNFTLLATIPANGDVWAGFETNDTNLVIYQQNEPIGTSLYNVHTYGNGPDPFGYFYDRNNTLNIAGSPFMAINYNPSSVSNFPYVTTLHYTNLTPTNITLAWTQPNMTGFTFHGYQIRYTTPWGTPNTILVNDTASSTTSYLVTGLTPGTQYSFQIGTWASGFDYYLLSNILSITSLTSTPPNLNTGNLNLNVGTNPLHVGYQFYLQNTNATKKDLFVSFPNTYNTTCNLDYQFANTNHNYYNLSTSPNGTGRVKADFQFFNLGNEIVTTVCRDIHTNDTGHYVITNSIDTIPLVAQVHNFDNGAYGTSGQFSGFDFIELLVIIISMIALNRVNETLGAIIMIFVLGGLAFFHIGSFPVIIFGAIAVVILLIVATTRKLGYTP